MSDQHSGVYFIRRSGDGAIKIGYSRDVARRIGALQTGCPDNLTLAGLMTGGTKADEWNLQQRFRALSIRGEWFKPTPELLEYVGRHPAPEYFNERRLHSRLGQRLSYRWAAMNDGPYPAPVPYSLSRLRIPCRIPVKRKGERLSVLLEWATAEDLASCERIWRREAGAAMARLGRAGPALVQTEDPAVARFNEFMCVWRSVEPILRSRPDWHAGDALRWLSKHEAEMRP